MLGTSLPDRLYFDRLMSGRPLTKAQYRQVSSSTLLTTTERGQADAKHHELLLKWLYARAFKTGDISRWAHGHIAINPSFSADDRQCLRDAIQRGDILVQGSSLAKAYRDLARNAAALDAQPPQRSQSLAYRPRSHRKTARELNLPALPMD